MTSYIALLRAVNVDGTGKLPMAELRGIAEELGFAHRVTSVEPFFARRPVPTSWLGIEPQSHLDRRWE